jgi:hypothetical protein
MCGDSAMKNLTAYNKGLHGEPRNFPAWYTRVERIEADKEYVLGRRHGNHKGKGI